MKCRWTRTCKPRRSDSGPVYRIEVILSEGGFPASAFARWVEAKDLLFARLPRGLTLHALLLRLPDVLMDLQAQPRGHAVLEHPVHQ